MVRFGHERISVSRQCELLGLARSSLYYRAVGLSALDQQLMKRIDEQYTARPFYGSRKMKVWLNSEGYTVGRKKVARLMRQMGLEAIYAKPRLSRAAKGHRLYPYLLRDLRITRPNQVWCSDISAP
jgi:putative transposase